MALKIPTIKSIFPQSGDSNEGINAKLLSKISYASIPGTGFNPRAHDTAHTKETPGTLAVTANGTFIGPIQLPQNAIIIKVVVWGVNMGAETWDFVAYELNTNQGSVIANDILFGTEHDATQTGTWIVNNLKYAYQFTTSGLTSVANMKIQGARVTYLTDYD